MGLRITLLVTGSIAAYKSAEIVRLLTKKGMEVRVAMSKAACEFITPLTLQTLSGNHVSVDMFDEKSEAEIGHISLADSADLLLVAPATANCLAKLASGVADDLVSTVVLASTAPVLIAPAMNVNMWESEQTQSSVSVLKRKGYEFIEPESGELACGWVGEGRLAEPTSIVKAVENFNKGGVLSDVSVLVTAGPTEENIDPIRFLSNRSSGKMGIEIARCARNYGAEVHLILGPSTQVAPKRVACERVQTAIEMRDAVFSQLENNKNKKRIIIFMAAAVSDHRPAEPLATKLKASKSESYQIEFVPNPDILSEIGSKRSEIEKMTNSELTIVGFTAETAGVEELLASAAKKMDDKKVDYIVANLAQEAMGADSARVWLLDGKGSVVEIPSADKYEIAERVIKKVASCEQ